MIRLDLPKTAYWLTLPHGVEVKVRPLDTALFETARAAGARMAREVRAEHKAITEAGGRVEDMPDISTPDGEEGLSQFLFAKALMLAGVLEWKGVAQADGEPAQVTPQTIHELAMIHEMAEQFMVQYTYRQSLLVLEGNASGPSLNGTLAKAPNTAKGAATKGSAARRAGKGRRAASALT